MKNYYLTVICGMFLLSSCGDNAVRKEKKSDCEEMGLVGKVQFLIESDDSGSTRYTFNEIGNLLTECYTRNEMDAEEVLIKEYTYGTDGKLTSVSCYNQTGGTLKSKEIYDANGNVTALETYQTDYRDSTKLYDTKHFVFDDKGLLIKGYTDEDDGKSYSEYECDAAGNVLKQTDYFNGSLSRTLRHSYKYDTRGNITEHGVYEAEIPGAKNSNLGEVVDKKGYKFDDADAMIEQIQFTYNHDGETHFLRQERFFHYKLDEHHNPIEITSSQCTYPYPREENGKKGSSDGIPIYFEYEYDAQGNWTSKKSDQNGRTAYTSRTVLYFE